MRVAQRSCALLPVLAPLLLGCGGGAYHEAVARQHAALYGCRSSEVHVGAVANRTWAASGCGRRAIYICRRGAVCAQEGETAPTTHGSAATPQEEESERRAIEERDARVRAQPSAPEVGATSREAEAMCGAQGGTYVPTVAADGGMALSCGLREYRLFSAHVNRETSRLDEVDVFIEGASVTALRDRYEREHGQPTETVDERGMRVWTWTGDGTVLVLRMFERGAWVTMRRP